MVNNFDLISDYIHFESEDEFYFLQIIKRKKDNPEMRNDNHLIRTYYISSIEQYDKLKDIIVKTCSNENARAYISLNKRSYKKTALETMKIIADYCMSGQEKSVCNAYNSACGKCHCDKNKTWIVDLDEKDDEKKSNIIDIINSIQPKEDNEKVKMVVPTKHGYHLISRPFDLYTFKRLYTENIDIHKDNPTVLYIPDMIIDNKK